MKSFLIILVLFGYLFSNIQVNANENDETMKKWQKYKLEFNKQYETPDEDLKR